MKKVLLIGFLLFLFSNTATAQHSTSEEVAQESMADALAKKAEQDAILAKQRAEELKRQQEEIERKREEAIRALSEKNQSTKSNTGGKAIPQ